jgi:hypothetical protein
MRNWKFLKLPTRHIKRERLKVALRFAEVVILGVGVWVAVIQLIDLRNVNAGQIALDITRDIYSDERYKQNPTIVRLIERGQPILKENGGPMDDEDLDSLLGEWSTVANFNQADVLPDDLVYAQFSFDIGRAYKNQEINDYIKNQRIKYKDPLLFKDYEWLAQWVSATENNK